MFPFSNFFILVFRKGLNRVAASTIDTSLDHSAKGGPGASDIATLLLRFLPTKDGVVMRRLLMTAVSTFMLDSYFSDF